MQFDQNAETAINILIFIWAKQYARTRAPHPKYVDRCVFNFQPGMTVSYLKYLLAHLSSSNTIEDTSLNNEHQRMEFKSYVENFDLLKQRITVVDKTNINSAAVKSLTKGDESRIFIVQCGNEDPAKEPSPFKSLIQELKRSKHSLIVFAEPLYGLQSHLIEKSLNIKVRNLVLPRLLQPLKQVL